MIDFEKFKEELPSKEKFDSFLKDRKITSERIWKIIIIKNMNIFLTFGKNLKRKQLKIATTFI